MNQLNVLLQRVPANLVLLHQRDLLDRAVAQIGQNVAVQLIGHLVKLSGFSALLLATVLDAVCNALDKDFALLFCTVKLHNQQQLNGAFKARLGYNVLFFGNIEKLLDVGSADSWIVDEDKFNTFV